MKILFTLVLSGLMWGAGSLSDETLTQAADMQDGFPAVCLIGDNEEEIDKLSVQHQKLLLSVCEDDMNVAYDKWMSMLQEMEVYAETINYDIRGVKLWLNVYWNEDGSIRQISFFPKPRSRNIENKELIAFFKGFMKRYRLPLSSDVKFAHYGMALFPTFAKAGLKAQNRP